MWIHIHHGETVFNSFLWNIALISTNLLVEPQPWRCYRKVKKRCIKNNVEVPEFLRTGSKEALSACDMEAKIINFLTSNDLQLMHSVYWNLGYEEWGRPLLIFHSASAFPDCLSLENALSQLT